MATFTLQNYSFKLFHVYRNYRDVGKRTAFGKRGR